MATSPVPHKLMTSLRTTKSEENLLANERPASASSANLQAACLAMPHSSSTGALCAYDDNNDCWTPEDDEISQQVGQKLFGDKGGAEGFNRLLFLFLPMCWC